MFLKKDCVFRRAKQKEFTKSCTDTSIMNKYKAWYLGFKMKINYSNLQSPIVYPHTHTHTHTALNSLLKTHTGIQYEHKGILQLTNGPQVNPKCLFYQQWPPVMILAPETGLKRTAVIWFHNMQQAHTHALSLTHTHKVSLTSVLSPTIKHGDKCSHSIVLLCN